MDGLDFNLHQAILLSLARNRAQERSGHDEHEDGHAGTAPGRLLSTFGLTDDTIHSLDYFTLSEANAVIALAEYVHELQGSDRSPTREDRGQTDGASVPAVNGGEEDSQHDDDEEGSAILAVLGRLHAIRIERCIGAQGRLAKWHISDQLAFAVGRAAIALAARHPHGEGIRALFEAYRTVKVSLTRCDASTAIEHLMPCIHGLTRACEESDMFWQREHLGALRSAVETLHPDEEVALSDTLRGSVIQSSRDGRHMLAVTSRYESQGVPLSARLLAKCDAVLLRVVAVGIVAGARHRGSETWTVMVNSHTSTPSDGTFFKDEGRWILDQASEKLDINIASLSEDTDLAPEDYEVDLVVQSLMAATAARLACHLYAEQMGSLNTLLADAPIYAHPIQATALQSLLALARRNRQSLELSIALLRQFIAQPVPILTSDAQGPSATLGLAADTLSSCIELQNRTEVGMSIVYAFINSLPTHRSETSTSIRSFAQANGVHHHQHQLAPASPQSHEERHIVSCSALYTVEILARQSKKSEIVKLALSMLLQRVRNADPAADSVTLNCIAGLAAEASRDDFIDGVKALADLSRTPDGVINGAGRRSIHDAQVRLARLLRNRPELAVIYLRELLNLFVDESAGLRAGKLSSEHKVFAYQKLLDTLSVIEILLAAASDDDLRLDGEEIVLLFRNMWFIAVAIGLTDPGNRAADIHRQSLRAISLKTPCLLLHTPLNYVETELEYNPLLRKEHGQSSERLRDELSTYIPSHGALHSRSLTYAQVVFLLTVARLESMRAELGNPSEMLNYFHNDGINSTSLLAPLTDIAKKVMASFLASFGQSVRRHTVCLQTSTHLKAMILQCSHPSGKTRRVAGQALDTIFAAYPVLLCDARLLNPLLESLTLLRDACESEYDDEYVPQYVFTSELGGITITLPDDYAIRNEILANLYRSAKTWLSAALAASPLEIIGLLQDYLDLEDGRSPRQSSAMGKSVAIEVARSMPQTAREAGIPAYGGWKADTASAFASAFGSRHTHGSEAKTVLVLSHDGSGHVDVHHVQQLKAKLRAVSDDLRHRNRRIPAAELRPLLYRAAAVILAKERLDYSLLRELVFIPVHAISPSAMALGVEVWAWLIDKRQDVESKLMVDLNLAWGWTVRRRRGFFSVLLRSEDPINSKTEYSPTDIKAIGKACRTVQTILLPHRYLLDFLASRFQAYRYRNKPLVLGCLRLVTRSLLRSKIWGKHPLCRELRMKLLTLGFTILNNTQLEASLERRYRSLLYSGALSWFEEEPTWSYGSDRLQMQEDVRSLRNLMQAIQQDKPHPEAHLSSREHATSSMINGIDTQTVTHKDFQQLLLLHLESEWQRLAVWINPLADARRGEDPATVTIRSQSDEQWLALLRTAWVHSPRLATLMSKRFKSGTINSELSRLVRSQTDRARRVPEALDFYLGSRMTADVRATSKHLVYWAPVSPVQVLQYFLPVFNREPTLLQYAMRTLEQHSIDLVFFYVPQVVQALRTDPLNYMERFIFETSKISQLFCHQMIWTMKANCFKDDLAEVPDPDKDKFERMVDLIVSSLSGEAQRFYEKEFGFFSEVTSISRTLMPFVKKTKPEKKAKIDEEMAKIRVEEGVYLPSHPEGQVVDIDRSSGRPLQSHAKTPFMATFKVSREVAADYSEEAIAEAGGEHTLDGGKDGRANEGFPSLQGGEAGEPTKRTEETKLSAIFKVGDDCRQDVLALQVIAQFKNMFNVYGLDVQVQPYKVLATGPGTGIIDVVPNATSRDEMGRAKINDLTQFFLFQFGPAESVQFQRARNNFIQSMAAYSVLCYILQIKDRHNGNIMIDGEGRITHIDFGFLFDIGPGGIKFEPNSFKLTHEMITLMGGKNSQGYRQFCELTVKAFLSARAHIDDVVATCSLMMPTGLPSFKGEGTMVRLRERFRPDLGEREAARYMMGVIDNACENSMSIVYDQFQYYQNKIPYAS